MPTTGAATTGAVAAGFRPGDVCEHLQLHLTPGRFHLDASRARTRCAVIQEVPASQAQFE